MSSVEPANAIAPLTIPVAFPNAVPRPDWAGVVGDALGIPPAQTLLPLGRVGAPPLETVGVDPCRSLSPRNTISSVAESGIDHLRSHKELNRSRNVVGQELFADGDGSQARVK